MIVHTGAGKDLTMKAMEFCRGLSTQIAGWRDRMYGIIGHVETLPALDRQYFSSDISALRAIISEIEDSIRQLRSDCPMEPADTSAKA